MKTGRPALALALFWIVCLSMAWAHAPDKLPTVDYRMAPLEQVKKLHAIGRGDGPTMTVMNLRRDATNEDYGHMFLHPAETMPEDLPGKLGGFDSVSWRPPEVLGSSACDSNAECQTRTDDMCDAAGHNGVISTTVEITVHADGTKTCSGDCQSGNAIAFVTCGGSAQCLFCE